MLLIANMKLSEHIPEKSILFAPMEGITDGPYRKVGRDLFPGWSNWCCDFLRVPTDSKYTEKKIISHFGTHEYESKEIREKTTYQILTSPRSNTIDTVEKIAQLGFKHLDLNLGCPSKKVNSHQGGAFLLSDLKNLEKIIRDIRKYFPHLFTVKIRAGYRNTENFENLIKLFENEGVEAITLHARTRDQLYKGQADWSYIKKAVEISSLPIIGNGDIWNIEDIENIFHTTNCHSVMIARGALKTPWLVKLYDLFKNGHTLDEKQKLKIRVGYIKSYFRSLETAYKEVGWQDEFLLKRFKGLTRYLFEDFDNAITIRSRLLRSTTLMQFKEILQSEQYINA